MTDYTHEETIDYEVARELLSTLVSFYWDDIDNEEAKLIPNLELIESLKKKKDDLLELRRTLGLDGHEPVANVIETIGPIVKARMQEFRETQGKKDG